VEFVVFKMLRFSVLSLFMVSDAPMTFGTAHQAFFRHAAAHVEVDWVPALICPKFGFMERHFPNENQAGVKVKPPP
jgi:hypothetical protein